MTEETATLPACLRTRHIKEVCNWVRWADRLFLVQKRLTGTRSGWFVVTIAGKKSFWDGPYTRRNALKRFYQQERCLQAVLDQVGASEESADDNTPMDRGPQTKARWTKAYRWNATEWEQAWDVVTRRSQTAPPVLARQAQWKKLVARINRAFETGDAMKFAMATNELVNLCSQYQRTKQIEMWW